MVDIVERTDIVAKTVEVVDRCIDVVDDDVFRNEVVSMLFQSEEHIVLVPVFLRFRKDIHQDRITDLFINADFFQFFGSKVPGTKERKAVDHTVGDDFDFFPLFGQNKGFGNTGLFDLISFFGGDHIAGVCEKLTGLQIDDFTGKLTAGQTLGDTKLLIIFIAAYTGEVIAAGVEEQGIEMLFRRNREFLHCWKDRVHE